MMTKSELKKVVKGYGDAIITYRSLNSGKLKYNVCTLDFDTPYIKGKKNKSKETKEEYQKYLTTTENPVPYRDWLKGKKDGTSNTISKQDN